MTSYHLTLISLLLTLTFITILTASSIDTTQPYEEDNESAETEDLKDEKEKGEIQPLLEKATAFESKKVQLELDIQGRDSYSKHQYGGSPSKDDPPKYDSFGSSYSHYGGSFYIPPKDEKKPPKSEAYEKPPVELPKPPKGGGFFKPPKQEPNYPKPPKEEPKPPKGYGIAYYKPQKEEPLYKPPKVEPNPKPEYYKPPKDEFYNPIKPELKPSKEGGYGGAIYKPQKQELHHQKPEYYKPPKIESYEEEFYKPQKEEQHFPQLDHRKPPTEGIYGETHYKPPKEEHKYPRPQKDEYPRPVYKPPKEEFLYPKPADEHYNNKPLYDSPFSKPPEHYSKPEKEHGYQSNKETVFPDDDFKEAFQPIPVSPQYKSTEESQYFKREANFFVDKIEPDADIDVRTESGVSLQVILDEVFGNSTSSAFTEFPAIYETTTQGTAYFDEATTSKFVPFKGSGCTYDHMECVAYYLCSNGTINKKGGGIVDIRIGEDEKEPECPFLEECCSLSTKVKTPLITVPPKKEEGCGFRNPEGVGFKISGASDHESEFGEFPWMVAIINETYYLYSKKFLFLCGASLIHPKVVLTAAHCVHNTELKSLRARAGEWDTQTTAEIVPYQDREIDGVVIHKYYSKEEGLVNDIALLFLKKPFEMAENVNPICLPPPDLNFDYSRCFATGWGKDSFALEGRYSTILKKIELPVVPNDKCEKALRTTRLGKYFELDESFICAGGELGIDTCKGDGGSPLVCPVKGYKDRYYQAGIVAWGIGCNDPIPGVYASVPYQRQWIDEQLKLRGIETSYYTIF